MRIHVHRQSPKSHAYRHYFAQATALLICALLQSTQAATPPPWSQFKSEPPGPSSRNTPIAFTEIMYRAGTPPAGSTNIIEFIELYNSNPYFEDISGYHLEGDIQWTAPQGTILQGFQYMVVARDPEAIRKTYNLSNVYGPYLGTLGASGTIQLQDRVNAVMLEVEYSNLPPWPVAADGTGHSLVLARSSRGEAFPQAWDISSLKGGSPGKTDPPSIDPLQGVVINEFLANPASPNPDFIELYNRNSTPTDISGAWLTDSPSTNKFRIPEGTILPAGGWIVYDATQLSFSLNTEGETIYLLNPSQSSILDAVHFTAQRASISSGRYPNGGNEWYPLQRPTPAASNSDILVSDIVINEIMYKPISENDDDGFVELYNQGPSPVDLSLWKFVSGISFQFPAGFTLSSHGFVVIAKNKSRLLSRYPGILTDQNTLGDYTGKPTRDHNRIALAMAERRVTQLPNGLLQTNIHFPVIDEVTFAQGGRWGRWANGDGSSLELRDPRANHRLPGNWGDSDETRKAPWTTIEATGLIDNSRPYNRTPINRLEVTMLNAGECLLDNVEVFAGTNTANRLSNPTFENGLAPWFPQGNHIQTTLEEGEGFQSQKSLHLRATARGDTGANRIRVAFSPEVNTNQLCTIRAKVRWLRGWPELVLRLKGNGFELPGVMEVPTQLGTPGAPNSQATTNAPPAIFAVQHFPVLPKANQSVVVTAQAQDPDGLHALTLHYRLDPNTQITSIPMNDQGIEGDPLAGDGIFSALLPGQNAGTLAAFYIEASDLATPRQSTRFPDDAPARECLVRFGEPDTQSVFGAYRFWMTARNLSNWINRPSLSNERVEGTFVYGNFRTIYNMGGKYSGSPYHQGIVSPMTAGCNYSLEMPFDDMLLGTENFNKIHAPGNGPFDDATGQAEQTGYWIMQQMDLPYNYRRLIEFYFNGVRKGDAFMEDTQTPGSDVLRQRFPDDNNGQLYKLQPWFEFDDVTSTGSAGAGFDTVTMCRLMNFYTGPNNNIKKLARYRYNWLTRAANNTANNYTNVWDLTDAANTPSRGDYVANMKYLVDMEEWMGVFAVQHSVGNWDSFGNSNAQNMYGYKPTRGKWTLLTWDFNIVLGNQGSDGPTGDNLFKTNTDDTGMVKIYETPEFRRMYLRSLKRIADGPMNGNALPNLVDSKYTQMLTSSTVVSNPAAIKSWVATRRNYLLEEVNKYSTNFATFSPLNYSTNSDSVTITGSAPLEVKTITVNDIQYPLSWINPNNRLTDPSYVTTWRITVPLAPGNNPLLLEALNLKGEKISGMSLSLSIERTSPPQDPRGIVVIHEIQYQPSFPNAAFVELFNSSTNQTFNIAGWRLDGLNYTFPPGSLLNRGQYLVLARDRSALARVSGLDFPVYDEYPGGLSDSGEVISLIQPGITPDQDLVIDRVRYEPSLPWPQSARGEGSSLQLIDASRDNSRVSNWASAAEQGWIKATLTATNRSPRLLLYLTSIGDAYIDDVSLTGPDGRELVTNGGFEAALEGTWSVSTNLIKSTLVTGIAHSGQSSLHLISTAPFPLNGNTNQAIWQEFAPFSTNRYTLSFWYLPSTNAAAIVARTLSSSPFLIQRSLAPVYSTPGTANNVAASLPAYDEIWLNEVLPYNVRGATDPQGDRDPWIELYNPGNTTVSLKDYFLTHNYSNLLAWNFPATATIGPKQFLTVWADGQPEATTSTSLHTSFSIPLTNGSIALVRSINGTPQPQIVDYFNYQGLGPDQSYGALPDGQPFFRQRFIHPTPTAPNDGTPPQVRINEWMAANVAALANPANGEFDDWFELYNPADTSADLTGFHLTDSANNRTRFTIPPNTLIPPGGFLLVWADKLPSSNSPSNSQLHVDFNLGKRGGIIALTAPDGSTIDEVAYDAQRDDISQGRYPDGETALTFMPHFTPGASNRNDGTANTAPRIQPVPDRTVAEGTILQFTASATDLETPADKLLFALEPGAPSGANILPDGRFRWRTLESQGPGKFNINIRVTDLGNPALSHSAAFSVTVTELNSPPSFTPHTYYTKAGELLSFPTAIDSDIPAQILRFELAPGAPRGLNLNPTSGTITWTPASDQVGLQYVTIRATDNGTPPLTTTHTYTISVTGSSEVLLVAEIRLQNDSAIIQCTATPGKLYQLQFTPSLSQPIWKPLDNPRTAQSQTISFSDNITPSSARYYRIQELP